MKGHMNLMNWFNYYNVPFKKWRLLYSRTYTEKPTITTLTKLGHQGQTKLYGCVLQCLLSPLYGIQRNRNGQESLLKEEEFLLYSAKLQLRALQEMSTWVNQFYSAIAWTTYNISKCHCGFGIHLRPRELFDILVVLRGRCTIYRLIFQESKESFLWDCPNANCNVVEDSKVNVKLPTLLTKFEVILLNVIDRKRAYLQEHSSI